MYMPASGKWSTCVSTMGDHDFTYLLASAHASCSCTSVNNQAKRKKDHSKISKLQSLQKKIITKNSQDKSMYDLYL